ncbi:MAG: tRNA preQ1(34) S-adenosylmethionine ribosyltransferase-isomerase QueA [Saprospiraceae bacterium]|nr:tRNA preQ1(34) S-adenosylmethionine ribosyltransferase-isomerase QueA [Pyrinomonadaceae bacterium]
MLISDFNYDLPDHLIAQVPLDPRQNSRMLLVDRRTGTVKDTAFTDISSFLDRGDLVVLNNTKVFPARLLGRSETGANVEIFLVEEIGDGLWITLARPARRLHPGKKIFFGERLIAEVVEKTHDGKIIVKYQTDGDFDDIVQRIGKTPLPPYIKRNGNGIDLDSERYQTVYAKERGAIAAPTAGLHFTPQIFDRIKSAGAEIAEITLHIGYGTFEPVRVTDVSQHRVASERYEITETTAEQLNTANREGRRIVAIGTTTTRALENSLIRYGQFTAGRNSADLTVTPGYNFRAVDALLTNFHLPQSSLLVLVSTFGGHELIMKAYKYAVESKYRFYSYGDCMLVF